MTNFRILYLEHSDLRDDYASAMKAAGAEVDCVDYTQKEVFLKEIMKLLNAKRYDVIITDAFFLPAGKDHDDEQQGDYLLDELVPLVRGIDDWRIHIIVMTYFTESILKNRLEVERIDDIWDKYASTLDYVKWKVERMKENASRHLPERALLNLLEIDIQNEKLRPSLQSKPILNSVTSYQKRLSEIEQIIAIKPDLDSISILLGKQVQPVLNGFINSIVENEIFNVAGSPTSWGHVRHSINVWWLGWYFLHCGWIDSNLFAKKLFPDKYNKSPQDALEYLDNAWYLSAIFHDIGKMYEELPSIVIRCNKLLNTYPIDCKVALENESIKKDHLTKFLTRLASASKDSYLSDTFGNMITNEKLSLVDHGIISSYTMFEKLKNTSIDKEVLHCACVAIAMHNWVKHNTDSTKSPNDANSFRLSLTESPLVTILVLCDQLQVWNRHTGLETTRSAPGIECAELRSIRNKNNIMEMVIDYISFRHVSPIETKANEIKDNLREIINLKVVPILDLIDLAGENAKLSVKFILDGRTEIRREWISS